jgi:glycosyltransferase involved in cell wall biosynthesis
MRITFVLPEYFTVPIGGYRIVYEYADNLAARGHTVTIAFPRWQYRPGETIPWLEPFKKRLWGVKIRLLNRPLVPWHSLHPRVKIAFVPAVQDRYMPDGDIVVATAWSTASPIAALSPTKGAKFYLIQHHETWSGAQEEVNATWRLPLHKIVISKWLQDLGEQLGATNIRHIPNGIDLRRFRIISSPATRRMSILSLYSRQEFKGVPDALAVLHRYHEKHPDVPVCMFGVQRRETSIPDWIQYFENPDQDALVRNIYNEYAVYVGASLTEGWALPPAEAMACGCAFVGTDIGGFREYATDGDTALLSPPGDRDGMLRNLIRITEDPTLLKRVQRRGTEHIQQFTWERAGSAMEAYFSEHT